MVLSSPGIASIVVFKNKANSMLRIQEVEKETENDISDEVLDMIAKSIVSEIKEIPSDKSNYQSRINIPLAKSDVSPTLAKLLSKIDSKALHPESLPAIYVGNIVTSQVAKRFTNLTLSLAVKVNKKKKIKTLSRFGAVSSYDELNRFRASAAAHSNKKGTTGVLRHHSTGLVEAVADNFDCNVSSANVLKANSFPGIDDDTERRR